MRSLRTKILLLVVSVVIAAQLSTVSAILYNEKEQSRDQAENKLQSAILTVTRFMEGHAAHFKQLSLSAVGSTSFRDAIASQSPERIQAELNLQRQELEVDFLLVTDADGIVIYSTEAMLAPGTIAATEAMVPGELFTTVIGTLAYEMLPASLTLGDIPAYLVVGAPIDDAYAGRIARLTGLDASFATDRTLGLLFLASSLDPLDRAVMAAGFEKIRSGGAISKSRTVVEQRLVSSRTPFVPKNGHVYLLLHQSLGIVLEPYKRLQVFMAQLVSTTLIVVFVLLWFVSTLMTRPLHQLAEAVQRITIGDYTKKVEVKTRDEIGSLAEVFNAMQDGIEQRENSILHQSLTDLITGLPNRQHALTLLAERIGKGNEIGVLLIDLGRFQHIRSTLGHRVADEMLRLSAARMKRSMPEGAILARLEGDEFLLVTPVSGIDAAMNEAETIFSLLDSGLSIRKARISLNVHIGVSLYPAHGDTADDLLRRASLAKQDAVNARTPLKMYQVGKGEAQARRLMILSDLRIAIDEQQFDLHVQPNICMTSGDIAGVEALVRWEHPELGAISPVEFIPLLEESGSISQLTRWVLIEALHHCALWKYENIDIPVSVNISVQDLKNENLPFVIDQMLLDAGLKPKNLILEVTEEALTRNIEAAISVLANLRKRGIRISMDDFGTGYSSLYQLKHLPIDELKIDREFIHDLPADITDVAIVRATIQLAKSMGLDVVAEGVESEEAWHFLAREGCKDAQGYLVSEPMPALKFVNWTRRYVQARCSPGDKTMLLQVDTAAKFAG